MEANKLNAVDMVRQIRDQQYEQTKDMDNSEKQAYYHRRTQALMMKLGSLIKKIRRKLVTA